MTQSTTTAPSVRSRRLQDAEWAAIGPSFTDFGFEQSVAYGRPAAARIGGGLQLVALESGSGVLAAAAIRLRRIPGLGRGIAWIPSGPLVVRHGDAMPDAVALRAILTALRRDICDRQGHVLRLRLSGVAFLEPAVVRTAAAAAGFVPHAGRSPYHSFALNLAQGTDTLMQRLNGKWRTDLRFAMKSGLELVRGVDAGLQARFLALFTEVQVAKGFQPDITPEFHFGLFKPGAAPADYALEILIATKDGVDVAGIVVGTAGPTTTYLFGATADAGRPLRAGYFLTWQAILLAQERGQRWYDLGGVDFDTNPDVARFKERMGGERIEAEVYEARPKGLVGKLIIGIETLRARLRG